MRAPAAWSNSPASSHATRRCNCHRCYSVALVCAHLARDERDVQLCLSVAGAHLSPGLPAAMATRADDLNACRRRRRMTFVESRRRSTQPRRPTPGLRSASCARRACKRARDAALLYCMITHPRASALRRLDTCVHAVRARAPRQSSAEICLGCGLPRGGGRGRDSSLYTAAVGQPHAAFCMTFKYSRHTSIDYINRDAARKASRTTTRVSRSRRSNTERAQ